MTGIAGFNQWMGGCSGLRKGRMAALLALLLLTSGSLFAQLTIAPTPAEPPQGTRGAPYAGLGFTVTGTGVTPYTFTVSSGALPPGLAFSSSTGAISGTPNAAGSFTFRVTVTDSTTPTAQTATTGDVTIVVVNPPLSITTTGPLPGGTVGLAYSAPLAATGGDGVTYNWSISAGALPQGLSITPSTGASIAISGTPALGSQGTYNFTLLVDDADTATAPATQAFSIVIAEAPAPSVSGVNPNSASRPVTGSPDVSISVSGAGFLQGAVVRFGSQDLSTTFGSATSLSAVIPAASLNLPQGTTSVTITVRNPDGKDSTGGVQFGITNANLVILTAATLPGATVGQSYSATISAEGGNGTYNWTLTGDLPAGLNLSSQSGASITLSGTPTTAGSPSFTLQVDDTDGATTAASRTFTLTIAPPPPPTLSSVSPSSANAGSGSPVAITLNGSNFISGAVALFGGSELATSFVSSTQLSATIPASLTSVAGEFPISVRNPGGAVSAQSVPFTLHPPPIVSALSPESVIAGSPSTLLTVTGQNFRSGAEVRFNGTSLATSFVSATTLTATIPSSLLIGNPLVEQIVDVTVVNPGGPPASSAVGFVIQPPPPGPVITELQPSSVVVGSPDTALTVVGQNFSEAAQIIFGGVALPTTPQQPGTPVVSLRAVIPSSALQSVASIPVTVNVPGVGESPAVNFLVRLPAPTISSVSPSTVLAGSPAVQVTVTGTNFESGAVLTVNGTGVGGAVSGATTLSATIPSSFLATPGTLTLSVRNPDNQLSNGLAFTVEAPAPTLSAVSPSAAVAGSASTAITLSGTNFRSGAVVVFDGTPLSPSSVSAGSISVTIPASLLIEARTAFVAVRNSDNKQSDSLPFTITAAAGAPILTSLSPTQVAQGSGDTVLVLSGSGFSADSRVLFRTGTLIPNPATATASSLTVTIPAALLATSAIVPVTVRNPGDILSNSVNFTVLAETASPSISALNPASTAAGTVGLSLSITGANFQQGAVLVFGASPLVSTVTGSTQITAAIPPALLEFPGTIPVTVRNPDGKTSNALDFRVLGEGTPPLLTVLTPNAAPAGSANTVMVLTGSNFSSGAVVVFGSTVLTPSAASANSLTVTIPAAQLAVARSVAVLVRNPDAQQSAALPFEVLADTALTITTNAVLPVGIRNAAYQAPLQALGGTPPYTWSVATGSTLPPGITLNPATGLLSGVPVETGEFTFTIQVTSNGGQGSAQREFRLVVRDFLITTTSLPAARVGVAYSSTLQFTGGPTTAPADYRWVLLSGANSLPPGITLNPATGVLSGTTTSVSGAFARFDIEVAVEHIPTGLRTPARTLSLTVAGASLEISAQSLPVAAVGQAYGPDGAGITIQALGGVAPYTLDVAASSLSQLLGVGFQVARPNAGTPAAEALVRITGTPTASGEIVVRIIARDGAGTELQRDLPLLVLAQPLRISPATLPPAPIGAAYQQALTVEGLSPQELAPPAGQPVVAWALENPPAGLSISPTGVLSGTFASAGSLSFRVRATTALRAVTQNFVLEVSLQPPSITTTALPGATVGSAYAASIEATGGTPGYTWLIAGVNLPAGLAFEAASVTTATLRISGTPQPGSESRTFSVTVRDAAGQTATRSFTLNVTAAPIPALSFAAIANPAPREQREVRLSLAGPYPLPLTGTASVSFTPNATNNADDPNIRFVVGTNNGRNATFRFEPNTTTAVFPNASPQLLQTGTVAGVIRLRAAIDGNGPQREEELVIARSAPVILDGVALQRTANGFTLTLTGYSTPRDLSSAQVTFTAPSGSGLQTTQVTIPLTDAANAWYNSEPGRANGSAFRLTLPFTVQGGANPVQSVSVTLTNSVGVSNARSASF